jgi:hypothetical protein
VLFRGSAALTGLDGHAVQSALSSMRPRALEWQFLVSAGAVNTGASDTWLRSRLAIQVYWRARGKSQFGRGGHLDAEQTALASCGPTVISVLGGRIQIIGCHTVSDRTLKTSDCFGSRLMISNSISGERSRAISASRSCRQALETKMAIWQ